MIRIIKINMCKECGNIFKNALVFKDTDKPIGMKLNCPNCGKDNSFAINMVMISEAELYRFQEIIAEKGW